MDPRWRRRLAVLPFVVLFLGAFVGGQFNRVDARGRIIDDTTNLPIPDVAVSFGSRVTATDTDGRYALDNVPRGAKIDTSHRYYGKHTVPPEQTELRIPPLTITFEVKDEYTTKGVDTPEARQPDDTQIGKGVSSGEMVVGPYPARNAPVLICAKNYQSRSVNAAGYQMDVALTPSAGSSCPPLKSPPPTPPPPTPAPSGSGSPAPVPAPSPSGTP